jgi:hypothetical protein
MHLVHDHMFYIAIARTISIPLYQSEDSEPQAGELTQFLSIQTHGEFLPVNDRIEDRNTKPAHLVIDRAEIDVCLEWLARNSAREHVLPSIAESMLDQDPAHILDLDKDKRRTRFRLSCQNPAAGSLGSSVIYIEYVAPPPSEISPPRKVTIRAASTQKNEKSGGKGQRKMNATG